MADLLTFGFVGSNSGILVFVLLIVVLFVSMILFSELIPEKKRQGLGKLGKKLHDFFNFKYLVTEKILQFLYIFATLVILIYGIVMLFNVEPWTGKWRGYIGLLIMIGGTVVARLAFEMSMLLILAVKNIIQINNKLKNWNVQEQQAEKYDSTASKSDSIVYAVEKTAAVKEEGNENNLEN
ncbi:MAG: hypothetical protein E7656_07355 [Ruminococcaceae bacterium]|nr:hypothetical protein [Oscillospiraceae bacterium]